MSTSINEEQPFNSTGSNNSSANLPSMSKDKYMTTYENFLQWKKCCGPGVECILLDKTADIQTTPRIVFIASPCFSKSLSEEDSVVSVYTTQATTSGTSGLDIYQQIANNLAERISSPFYRLFRVERNKTDHQPITKKPWEKIELLDDPESNKFKDNNDIEDRGQRDTEELSPDALKKVDKKPEKITLYNSYLPVFGINQKLEQVDLNDTMNSINDVLEDELTLDDVDPSTSTGREGPFIYILELIGSFIQLIIGALSGIFPSSSSSSTAQTEQTN